MSQHNPDYRRERLFIDTFIIRVKRDRYNSLMSNPQKRQKLLDRMNHNLDFDYSLAKQVECYDLEKIEAKLISLGATPENCYFISDSCELDQTTVSLKEGLKQAADFYFASILDCVAGKLAIYWDETYKTRRCFILLNASE